MMAIAYDSAGATLSSRRTGARHDVRATRLWRKFGRADVTRLLYAESLVVSYRQPRFEAGRHTVANRGARPNELFLKMTAVEERSKWNRSLLCLSAACQGQTWEGN